VVDESKAIESDGYQRVGEPTVGELDPEWRIKEWGS